MKDNLLRIHSTALFAILVTLSAASNAHAQTLTQKLKSETVAALARDAREKGNAVSGAILFPRQKLRCAACHIPGRDDQIGSDLTRLGDDATSEHLVEALLDPSKVIRKGYDASIVSTQDGRSFTGRIIQQDAQRIVFRDVGEPTQLITLVKDDIEEINPSKLSAMPDGLVDQLGTRQEFLDLIRYLMEIATTGRQTDQHTRPSGSQSISDELQGLVLLDQLNCSACHRGHWQLDHRAPHHGPTLKWSTGNTDPHYIQRFIANPTSEKPGTTMPHVLDHLDEASRDKVATAITHYLVSLANSGQTKFQHQAIDRIAARRGQELFHTVGCVACHSPRDEQGQETLVASSVPLGDLNSKHRLDGLIAFLEDPHVARPAGSMPNMQLSHWEARDIANYLLRDTQVTGNLQYTVYEGNMHEGFGRLTGKEVSAGIADEFSLAPFKQYRSDFAILFAGFLVVTTSGDYTFSLACNDGGQLRIDGKELITLPPKPGDQTRSATARVQLPAGTHAIQLSYLQLQNHSYLDLQLAGPGLDKGAIPASRLQSHEKVAEPKTPFMVDTALADQGKTHFGACVQCHNSNDHDAPKLVSIDSENLDKGCLSGKLGNWPQYSLSDTQRQAMRAAMRRDMTTLTNAERIAVTMTRLRCVACHERDGVGGVPVERDEHFHTLDPNLGPQGRLPPRLTGAGAKLKPEWMRDVLVSGKTIRPYMQTRMPQFGEKNVAHLVELLGESDELPETEFGEIKDHKEARNIGTELIGNKGLNCVACHTFQHKPSQTMSAVDLTELAERLKKKWFFHYMRDPQQLSPRTVMPSFWPGGRAIRTDVLDGDVAQQIEHIWYYLQDGRQARTPRGMKHEPMELLATNEAVMLRRSYQGIGKRGIGVGYPGQLNLAFDAEQMRLAMIWKGKFADPGGVWRGQGSGTVRPAGERPIQFAKGPDLDDAQNPWVADDGRPPQHQFTGYFLDELRRPTFMYRFDGVDVEDFSADVASDDSTMLRRTITLRAPAQRGGLMFRVCSGEEIVKGDDGWFVVGDKLRVRVVGGQQTEINVTLTGKQLMVPLTITNDKSTLVIEYSW